MNSDDLSKLPTIERLRELIEAAKAGLIVLPEFEALLKNFDVDIEQLQDGLSRISAMSVEVENLAQLQKRFNSYFLSQGWIAHESLNIQVAADAIERADAGDLDGAEQLLVSHYSDHVVKFWLGQMNSIDAFQPRMRLARLALDDYRERRYHACIPVILSLVDGLVNELNKGSGFFKKDADLVAWDSIAGHPEGLTQLAKVLSKERGRIHTEAITIPYRNGILHGNDLSYDNQVVAAKTWALLFAVADWARKIEKGERNAPPTQQPIGWEDLFGQLQSNLIFKRQLNEWKPRTVIVGEHIPSDGNIYDYGEGTPERTLVEFLNLWSHHNYGEMSKLATTSIKVVGAAPHEVRDVYNGKELTGFKIKEIADRALSATNIVVTLFLSSTGIQAERDFEFRLLYLDKAGKAQPRNVATSKWYIVNWRYLV